MKLKKFVAKKIAEISLIMAKAANGTASQFGSYQPKEPEALNLYFKE